jgi:hypothetical protein
MNLDKMAEKAAISRQTKRHTGSAVTRCRVTASSVAAHER